MSKQLWLDDTWRSRTGMLAAFFKLRSRKIALVGAFIVFATFVIKETWRDASKDHTDALATAQSVFTIRDDSLQLVQSASRLAVQIGENNAKMIYGSKGPSLSGPNPYLVLSDDLELAWETLERIESGLQNNKRLLAVLDNKAPPLVSQLQGLDDRFVRFQQNRKKDGDSTLRELLAWGQHQKVFNEETYFSLQEEDSNLAAAQITLLIDTRNLGWDIFQSAEKERQKSERRYKRFAVMSFVLYAIGWSLSFANTMFGVDSPASIEE